MQSETDPLVRLWSAARAVFARMRAAVGEAAAIALRPSLEARERRVIAAWLRPLEAFVRRIVLIEAAALALHSAPPPGPRAARRTAPASRERTASFRLWPRPKPAPARIRALGPPVLVREVWRDRARLALARRLAAGRAMRRPAQARLARRIEALARVIAHPHAAARRLARKLRALPRLALELAARPAPRSAHCDDRDVEEARARAFHSAWGLNSS